MRIGISTSVIERGQTGIARYVCDLTRSLARLADGHRLVLFVLREDLPLFDFVRQSAKLVPVSETFRPPLKNILWHQRQLPALAREHRLDVLHVPSYRRLLWPQPCALVATIHDLAPFRVMEKYDWKRRWYARVVVKRLARRQHEIIAVSQQTAAEITSFFRVPAARITVIHNGVDHERFHPGSREEAKGVVAERFGLRDPFFLYVARLEHPAKNHARLVEAFNQFKTEMRSSWQLVLAGADWQGAAEIHTLIGQSLFKDDIRCLGFVPDAVLPELMRAADVFVYPSVYEGFGLPPLEAMACGCPVICSNCPALAEVVADAATLVNPTDVADLTTQLLRLALSADLREAWATAGRARAEQFNWTRAAEETLKVYSQAAERFGWPRLGPAIEDFLIRP